MCPQESSLIQTILLVVLAGTFHFLIDLLCIFACGFNNYLNVKIYFHKVFQSGYLSTFANTEDGVVVAVMEGELVQGLNYLELGAI